MLKQFFVVTGRSLYLAAMTEAGGPYLEKLAGTGNEVPIGHRFDGGEFLALTGPRGAFPYNEDYSPFRGKPARPQRPEDVNTAYWRGGTSPIVALFLTREQADACYATSDRQSPDPRWVQETRDTLDSITDEHPCFIISQHSTLMLLPPEQAKAS
jgi:hypothetical protein